MSKYLRPRTFAMILLVLILAATIFEAQKNGSGRSRFRPCRITDNFASKPGFGAPESSRSNPRFLPGPSRYHRCEQKYR